MALSWLLMPGVALYLLLLLYLDRKEAKKKPVSDEEYLTYYARAENKSEYDIFIRAAQSWYVSENTAVRDFDNYLNYSHMPHYVRDFIRKERERTGNISRPPELSVGYMGYIPPN